MSRSKLFSSVEDSTYVTRSFLADEEPNKLAVGRQGGDCFRFIRQSATAIAVAAGYSLFVFTQLDGPTTYKDLYLTIRYNRFLRNHNHVTCISAFNRKCIKALFYALVMFLKTWA